MAQTDRQRCARAPGCLKVSLAGLAPQAVTSQNATRIRAGFKRAAVSPALSMMSSSAATILVSGLALGLVGCGVDPGTRQTRAEQDDRHGIVLENEPTTAAVVDAEQRQQAREAHSRGLPERVPDESRAAVTGEAPEPLLREIKADLARRLAVDAVAFTIVRSQAMTWADGSLGCPKPDQIYTQAPVPGYWVVLAHRSREYDYRASATGYFFLCEFEPRPRPGGMTQPNR